jgi:hypothetical protein
MRKAIAVLFVAAALAGGSAALADNVSFTRNLSGFANNFHTGAGVSAPGLNWGLLGANNYIFGGSSFTESGSPSSNVSETVTVNFPGFGIGDTVVQCPAAACSWNGAFAPGQVLFLDIFTGAMSFDFSKSVSGIGFQAMSTFGTPVPNDTYIEIGVYNGSTLLASFSSGLLGEYPPSGNNTAGFYGVTDLTGANITSIKLLPFICPSGPGSCYSESLVINHMLLDVPATTPEPASLALLGSGLGLLGFLRRKLAVRK